MIEGSGSVSLTNGSVPGIRIREAQKHKDPPTDPDPNNCLPVTRFGYIISDNGSNVGTASETKFFD